MVKDFWSMTSDGLVESGRVGVSVVINGYVVEPDSRSVVSIPFGQHELRHGVPYGLRFDNHRTNMAGLQYAPPRRTYVAVTIDGVFQGEWILLAGRMGAFTDRGAHDSGIWTFFASQSAAGRAVGASSTADSRKGLIQVLFTPEWVSPYEAHAPGWTPPPMMYGSPAILGVEDVLESYSPQPKSPTYSGSAGNREVSGVTGLTGQSNVQFTSGAQFTRDETLRTSFQFRLVANIQGGPRPLRSSVPPTFPTY